MHLFSFNFRLLDLPSAVLSSAGMNHSGGFLEVPTSSSSLQTSSSSQSLRKVDPVFEVAPNLTVKIADLGNACWVVSVRLVQRIRVGMPN